MRASACVMLRHESRSGSHYDFMLEAPAGSTLEARGGAPPLLTWRVMQPTTAWRSGGVIELVKIADHRRAYLRREGKLTGGRGWVRRVDSGTATVRAWHADGGTLRLNLRHFHGEARLVRLGGERFFLHLL